ncbi:hypothetical protein MVEN_01763100 [Mycena venus]|uniref:Uncharacterized protein n=1 Tax=Mycena venus TaxID=2733690 RepID=A0A8H6XKJ2_9AGAR|nr:hypothetical protein MVEN_01763100 [Mycena venus]
MGAVQASGLAINLVRCVMVFILLAGPLLFSSSFPYCTFFSIALPLNLSPMKIPFSLLFAIVFSLDAFAAPVPNANSRDDFALEVRKATKVAAKKPPVKAKAPAIKAKPLPKKVAPKPAKPAEAPKPVAKKPVAAPAKKPAAKAPVAQKPVAKPTAKKAKPPAKKPAAKASTTGSTKPAAKPAAKPPVKPAAKKVTAPAKKPVAKAPVAKPSAKAAPSVAKPSAKSVATGKTPPAKAAPAAKVPASCAVRKKPVVKSRADAEDLSSLAKRESTPITACGVNIRKSGVARLCKQQKFSFAFANDALVRSKVTRRATDSEEEDTDSSESEPDDPNDEDFVPDSESEGSEECDHVLELQVLKKTLELPGGVCDTLKAMIASPNSGLTTDNIPSFMADIKTAINAKSNLFFLDGKVNKVKRDEVKASLKGQAPKASVTADLSNKRVAVNKYLTDTSVKGPSINLAKKLDDLVDQMLTKAENQALANIKNCAGATAAADEKTLKAAKAKLKTSSTLTSAWNNVLTHVAAQAKI